MNKDKELLLKYLCMALPYKVIIKSVGENKIIGWWDLRDIDNLPLPYLRPMSSMTEEEMDELESITFPLMEKDWDGNENPACIRWIDIPKYMDFILSHHFDYQGLIEKGLALEAPGGMYVKLH